MMLTKSGESMYDFTYQLPWSRICSMVVCNVPKSVVIICAFVCAHARLRVLVRVSDFDGKCFVGAGFGLFCLEIRRRNYCCAYFSPKSPSETAMRAFVSSIESDALASWFSSLLAITRRNAVSSSIGHGCAHDVV